MVTNGSVVYSNMVLEIGTWHVICHFSYNCVTSGVISIETGYIGTNLANSFDFTKEYSISLPAGAIINRRLEGFVTITSQTTISVFFQIGITSGTYQQSVSTANPKYNTLKAYRII